MATYYIDALNSGYRWNSSQPLETPIALSYAVPDSQPSYYGSFLAYPDQHRDGIRAILEHVETVTNISFSEVATAEQAHLAFSYENLDGSIVGQAYYPYVSRAGFLSGDVFIDTRYQNDPAMAAGDQQYTVVLHEVGHALGLKHPFEGSANLPAAEDSHFYSVMSYNWVSGPYVETFSIYDIATLQHLYGANLAHNAGDTAYDLTDYLGSRQTLWDGGGVDELDGSAFAQGLVISLEAGSFIDLDRAKNLAIALDVTIENARGGSGNDQLTGNAADNTLIGNAGDDLIEGGQGDDRLDGGAGFDTLLYRSLFGDFDFVFLTSTEISVTSTSGTDWGRDLVTGFELFQFDDIGKTFQEIYDAFASPAPQTDIALSLGLEDPGAYGYQYFEISSHPETLTAGFTGTGADVTLSVVGWDIDVADEVEVLLNGDSLGFLSTGPNESHNAGDSFVITAEQQLSGGNVITFAETTPGWKWGVTDILLTAGGAPPPAADIALSVGVAEQGQYGNRYAGQAEPDGQVTARFVSGGTDLTLSLAGYDIDTADEVEVSLNGATLGFLTLGPNEGLNGGDSFAITAGQQLAGENTLTFSQARDVNWKWGVSDILLEEGLPPADIALTLGRPESGQYGNLYAGQAEPDGEVTASFFGSGLDLTLSLTGYDIDTSNEVEVLLNGSSLGFLAQGPNEDLNAGDSFAITAGQQDPGENTLTFAQARDVSWKWGVTDILLTADDEPVPSPAPSTQGPALRIEDVIGGDEAITTVDGKVEQGHAGLPAPAEETLPDSLEPLAALAAAGLAGAEQELGAVDLVQA